ncbi:MAG: hypothetical protein JSV91_02550 [Phycisphaerales bacterium]|nr:MAG: hypothetical protein JSV91_02550 [Phycisphaerales bacterium]
MAASFMNSVWPDYVDGALPLDRKQRKVIHKAAWKLWGRNGSNIVLYLALPAGYLVMLYLARQAVDLMVGGVMGPLPRVLRIALLIVVPVLCFIAGGAILQRYRFAPCVYRAIRDRGFDVCLKCGYWLRGLGDEVKLCPECGAERELPPDPPDLPDASNKKPSPEGEGLSSGSRG